MSTGGSGRPRVLVIQHVAWEGPHRIARHLHEAGLEAQVCMPLAGDRLPAHESLAGAVVMGGPMNVDDTARHPALADEVAWVERALAGGLPLLGVCLGSQLIARALGAPVSPGPRPEIGWLPIEVTAPDDPVLGPLGPAATVLHWHGDAFPVPPGAVALARSELTGCQAFRHGPAWGLLFHAEADAGLVERWLAEPAMAHEARDALGEGAPALLRAGARRHGPALEERSGPGFAHLAGLMRARAARAG